MLAYLLAAHTTLGVMTDGKRQLSIRTGAVKRLSKELKLYQDERDQEQARVEKLRAGGAERHDVKHAVSRQIQQAHLPYEEIQATVQLIVSCRRMY